MPHLLLDLGLFGLLTSTISALLALFGLVRFLQGGQGGEAATASRPSTASPPVSLLKPLDGDEPSLEAHLESFFRQEYPQFEILF
ncbi:MAG TPA: glycosyl transferase, partial [Acidobacteriaceae bacterium]